MLWLDDPTTDDEGCQPTLPSPHSTAATITFSPPPQWRVAQRSRRRDKRRGIWPLKTSQSAFSLTSIAVDAGSSSSSLTKALLRPSTPGHASSSSSSSSSSSFLSPSRSVGRVKYTKAIAHLSLRHAINLDTTSDPDSSPSTTAAHLCHLPDCLACSAVANSIIPSPCGAVWPSEAELEVEGLTLPAVAPLRPLSSYHASVNSNKPSLFVDTASAPQDHIIAIPGSIVQQSQHSELVPMLPAVEPLPTAANEPITQWWQRLNVPRLVVSVQCLISIVLLAAAAYVTPSITHTSNLLPAYLLPASLFVLCVHTLSQSTSSSPPVSRPTTSTRFITLSSVLSLGLLSYSLYCLFSPAPILGQSYVYETLEQMSSSLRSFVSLALLYFVSAIVLCCLLLLLVRAPASNALHRALLSPGRGKGASLRRLPSVNHLELFIHERKMARQERQKRKQLQSPASFLQRSISDGSSGASSISSMGGRSAAHRALLKSCVSMPCMERMQ